MSDSSGLYDHSMLFSITAQWRAMKTLCHNLPRPTAVISKNMSATPSQFAKTSCLSDLLTTAGKVARSYTANNTNTAMQQHARLSQCQQKGLHCHRLEVQDILRPTDLFQLFPVFSINTGQTRP